METNFYPSKKICIYISSLMWENNFQSLSLVLRLKAVLNPSSDAPIHRQSSVEIKFQWTLGN